VIRDQVVFGTYLQVHGVPAWELVLHLVECTHGNLAAFKSRSLLVNVVKDSCSQLLCVNLFGRLGTVTTVQVVGALQRMGNCVLSHINGTVPQTLIDPNRVAWEVGSHL
jgi:hypothetical protein